MGLPPADDAGRRLGWSVFEDRFNFADTDVLHNDLDIEVFPATQTIAGSNTITIRSNVEGLTTFTFVLASGFQIGTVLVNATPVAAPVSVGTWGRQITLDRPYALGEQFTVTIPYQGVAQTAGLGSVMWSSQGGFPVVSTLSQPFYAATWWPCKDADLGQPGDNSDKATWRIAITHDAALTGVSNGTLQGVEDLGSGRVRTRWASAYPMSTYLACFSVARYNAWTMQYTAPALQGTGTVSFPVRFFIYSSFDNPVRRAAWERVLPMLDAFRPVFGEYPFPDEGYGIYNFPFGGGMEHQTMVGQGTFIESVSAHELAHMWWGNDVGCRTWRDLWLNEGLATYSEAVWAERQPGSSGLPAYSAWMNARRPDASALGGTVYTTDLSSVENVFNYDMVYEKGAWVFHMLRGMFGDAVFYEILREWRARYSGSAATTEDFRDVAEDVSGTDLSAFFQQWVYSPGAPAFAAGIQSFTHLGTNWVRIHLRQTQNPAWPTYTTPINLRLLTAADTFDVRLRPSARINHWVRPTGAATAFNFILDPQRWVLATDYAGEAYIPGPPVVLQTLPVPGSISTPPTSPASIRLFFSDPTTIVANDLVLERSGGTTPVDFDFSYDAPSKSAILTFSERLSPSTYTLRLAGQPAGAGGALDSDVADPAAPSSFPSGDGNPGAAPGSPLLSFTVTPASCPADLNLDSVVDNTDFVIFAQAYSAFLSMTGDLDGDGLTDNQDFVLFADAYAVFECP